MQDLEEIVSIGELCKMLGLTTRTLRYWEEVGFIESVERSGRENRGYTPYYVRRIKFIMRLKELGLTIKELQHLYRIYGGAKQTDRMIPELVSILDVHVNMIDEKMEKLLSLRNDIIAYRNKMADKLATSIK